MTTTEQLVYEVDTLVARIADNEAIYGPECRPELRDRLAVARRRLRLRILESRDVTGVRLTSTGKLHANDDFGLPACGAYAHHDPLAAKQARVYNLDARSYIERGDTCGRCVRVLEAWATNE